MIAAAVAVAVLAGGAAATARADTETLQVSVSAEAVSISITDGAVDFGGPHPSGTALQAHPQLSVREAVPPTVTNTGNVDLSFLSVGYTGVAGAEATCDSGSGSWAAHATTAASDQFVMKALASSSTNIASFNSNALPIAPSTGTGNILAAADAPLTEAQAVPLQLELRMPNPAVAGAHGCAIGLVVTAAAAG